jgi:hypothetical protein
LLVNDQGEPLEQAQPFLARALVDGHPNSTPERSIATGSGDDSGDGDTGG